MYLVFYILSDFAISETIFIQAEASTLEAFT